MALFRRPNKDRPCLTWLMSMVTRCRTTIPKSFMSIALVALIVSCEETTGPTEPATEPTLAGTYTAVAGATTLSLDVKPDGFVSVAVTAEPASPTATGSRSFQPATARDQDTRPTWVAIEGRIEDDAATITSVEEDGETLTDSALDAYLDCNPLATATLATELLDCIGATGSEPPEVKKQSPSELLVGTWRVSGLGGLPGYENSFNGWEWIITADSLSTSKWDRNDVRGSRLRWSIELSNTKIRGITLEYDEICNDQYTGDELQDCLDRGTANGSGGLLPAYYVVQTGGAADRLLFEAGYFGLPVYLTFERVQ